MAHQTPCKVCGALATVHLTQIHQNKIVKTDLCEACARDSGLSDGNKLMVEATFEPQWFIAAQAIDDLVCPTCALTSARFRKHGQFGCPDCYEAFSAMLPPILKHLHRGEQHTGKVPVHARNRFIREQTIRNLERTMQEAIEKERFEEAAELRDRVRALRLLPTSDFPSHAN